MLEQTAYILVFVERVLRHRSGSTQCFLPDVLVGVVGTSPLGIEGHSRVGRRVRNGRRRHERDMGLADGLRQGHALLVLATEWMQTTFRHVKE